MFYTLIYTLKRNVPFYNYHYHYYLYYIKLHFTPLHSLTMLSIRTKTRCIQQQQNVNPKSAVVKSFFFIWILLKTNKRMCTTHTLTKFTHNRMRKTINTFLKKKKKQPKPIQNVTCSQLIFVPIFTILLYF